MQFDLDRYYTPKELARRILSDSVTETPKICVDSTCGSGNLLEAARDTFSTIKCVGIDRDKNTIINLRRKNPDWILSVADLLKPSSYKRTIAVNSSVNCDLLVLNPPFSQHNKKFESIRYSNRDIKCSVAMAYILKSFELFRPNQGAVVIVPESMLYSEIDEVARYILQRDYEFEIIDELVNSTFKGARARAVIMKISPGRKLQYKGFTEVHQEKQLRSELLRGGLPVHQVKNSKTGVPFIHTTSFDMLVSSNKLVSTKTVHPLERGLVFGHNILFPRVGIPNIEKFKCIFLHDETQLSDCVIALKFKTAIEGKEVERRIKSHWDEFVGLYRGTGARYVTLYRLKEWLNSVNIRTD